RVVGVGAERDGDRVAADATGRGGGGGEGVVQHIAVDRADHRGGQRGVGVAVGLGLGISCDGGSLGVDRERAIGRRDGVVGVGAQRDGDRVAADATGRGGGGGEGVVQGVAVDRADDRGGQRGVGVAVGLGLGISCDGGSLGVDRERAIGRRDAVVGVGAQRD